MYIIYIYICTIYEYGRASDANPKLLSIMSAEADREVGGGGEMLT